MDDSEEIRIPERTEKLTVTVGEIWREARVSCPHRDLLRAYKEGGLDEGAADYVRFHIEEAKCPYCAAQVDDLLRVDAEASKSQLEDIKERLLSSTRILLEQERDGR